MDEKKSIKSVKISEHGMKSLTTLYKSSGVLKTEIVSRAIEWLAKQDKSLQAVVLGQLDPQGELAVLDLIRNGIIADAPDALRNADIRYSMLTLEDRQIQENHKKMNGPAGTTELERNLRQMIEHSGAPDSYTAPLLKALGDCCPGKPQTSGKKVRKRPRGSSSKNG